MTDKATIYSGRGVRGAIWPVIPASASCSPRRGRHSAVGEYAVLSAGSALAAPHRAAGVGEPQLGACLATQLLNDAVGCLRWAALPMPEDRLLVLLGAPRVPP